VKTKVKSIWTTR